MAGKLPIIKYGEKFYFVDDRLREIRNVYDFMDRVLFENIDEQNIKATDVPWDVTIDEDKWEAMF